MTRSPERLVHPLKVYDGIELMFSGRTTLLRLEQPEKQPSPKFCKDEGITNSLRRDGEDRPRMPSETLALLQRICCTFLLPSNKPVAMVEPERERPGITAQETCAIHESFMAYGRNGGTYG